MKNLAGGKKDCFSDDVGGEGSGCEAAVAAYLPQNIVEIHNISLEIWKVLKSDKSPGEGIC